MAKEKKNEGQLLDGMKLQFVETDAEGNILVVDTEKAREAMKAYFQDEIGSYIDQQFKLKDDEIREKVKRMDEKLTEMIDNQLTQISEQIVNKLVTHKVQEVIGKIVNKKLGILTENINEEIQNMDVEAEMEAEEPMDARG